MPKSSSALPYKVFRCHNRDICLISVLSVSRSRTSIWAPCRVASLGPTFEYVQPWDLALILTLSFSAFCHSRRSRPSSAQSSPRLFSAGKCEIYTDADLAGRDEKLAIVTVGGTNCIASFRGLLPNEPAEGAPHLLIHLSFTRSADEANT